MTWGRGVFACFGPISINLMFDNETRAKKMRKLSILGIINHHPLGSASENILIIVSPEIIISYLVMSQNHLLLCISQQKHVHLVEHQSSPIQVCTHLKRKPAVSSVSCFIRKRPRTFAYWLAVIG